ncbi:MAG: methyltransferase [Methanobacterium sp.]|nr:methyltransferase [Methanobacterium sp.]
MDLKCRCNQDCITPPDEILEKIDSRYYPCKNCPELRLKKFKPLVEQLNSNQRIDKNWGKCNCGRRHLDLVVAHILTLMQEEGIKDEKTTLRETCVPLITPAYPLNTVPYLPENSLIILSSEINTKIAKKILNEVPEVKGVLKGEIKDTVGIKDSQSNPKVYELLAGCDMRSDVVQTPYGPIFIYKYQGEIHVEFPKPLSPKISQLKRVMEKYEDPKILDCTCGPGTLGITALKGKAKKVVFNDIWYPAAFITSLNLEVNGFPVKLTDHKENLVATGKYWDVYCLDVKELGSVLNEKFDICLVDTFPGVDTNYFETSISDICGEIVII